MLSRTLEACNTTCFLNYRVPWQQFQNQLQLRIIPVWRRSEHYNAQMKDFSRLKETEKNLETPSSLRHRLWFWKTTAPIGREHLNMQVLKLSATVNPPCRCILTASSISADLSWCLISGTFIEDNSFPVLLTGSPSTLSNWPAVSTGRIQRTKLTLVFRMASKMVSWNETNTSHQTAIRHSFRPRKERLIEG